MDATPEQIFTEFWARYYDDRRLAGKEDEEEFEDEEFDLDEVLNAMESDDWQDVLNVSGGE